MMRGGFERFALGGAQNQGRGLRVAVELPVDQQRVAGATLRCFGKIAELDEILSGISEDAAFVKC
ncbi:MAG: hypothetical protein EBX72_12190, partial [Betaproteobacteria bacterium]|nr:hypothetical protein [Betaproteobacteria bacterium]